METIDFKKLYRAFYSPSAKAPQIVDVPPMRYLMVDGSGDPNTSPLFRQAIEALYSVAYTLKFSRKKAGIGPDFTMGPLQGLWWSPDDGVLDIHDKSEWLWTLLLWLPDIINEAVIDATVESLRTKKPNPLYGSLRLEEFDEGQVAQIMHIGPYAAEEATIRRLHAFAAELGYRLRGKHHEIYLGDPRRSAPEKLKTIIRQPVASP